MTPTIDKSKRLKTEKAKSLLCKISNGTSVLMATPDFTTTKKDFYLLDLNLKVSATDGTARKHWSLEQMIIVRYFSNNSAEMRVSGFERWYSQLTNTRTRKIHHGNRRNELFACPT